MAPQTQLLDPAWAAAGALFVALRGIFGDRKLFLDAGRTPRDAVRLD